MASSDVYRDFVDFFPNVLSMLKSSAMFSELPDMQEWITKVIEYNVQGGKMNRGLAVIETCRILTNNDISEEDKNICIALGWAVELLQAFFLVADDIMDDSYTRRNKPCWFRTNNLGVKAFNDAILLESAIYHVLQSYCKDKPYYKDVLELFHEVTMRTSLGQAMDLHTSQTPGEKADLTLFTQEKYDKIVKYKTAYYSFYLPVILGMHVARMNDKELHKKAEAILLPMGHFFQVQDDFLDCFGDPNLTGKVGTDIEDGKCSWLVVTALQKCNSSQLEILQDKYGVKDVTSVEEIKRIFRELEIERLFKEYEETSYSQLLEMIEKVKEEIPTSIFKTFATKIYKRNS